MKYMYNPLALTLIAILIVVVNATSTINAQHKLFEAISAHKNKISVTLTDQFKKKFLHEPTLTFTYPDDINLEGLDESILTAGAIMSLAPMIWISQKKFYVDVMDEDLYHSLKKIHHVFKLFYPERPWEGEIIPHKLKKNHAPPLKQTNDTIVLLFSGGLDSVYSSFQHLDKKQLLVVIGGKDVNLDPPDAWQKVLSSCTNFAQTYGHCLTHVTFNLNEILNHGYVNKLINKPDWWTATLGSLTHIGAIFPIAYLKGHSQILIASSCTIDYPAPFGNHPLIDNNLQCAQIKVVHDGGEHERVEKIGLIIKKAQEYSLPLPTLRVCQSRAGAGKNCNICIEKCLPTIHCLLAHAQNPHEWGFNISLKQTIQATGNALNQSKKLSPVGVWIWEGIQKVVRKALKGGISMPYDDATKSYLKNFVHINFRSYCKVNYEENLKILPFFAHIWRLAYDDPDNKLMTIEPSRK